MNAEQRNYVQSIVDTLVFVEEKTSVDKYRCLKCDTVAVTPYVTNCKHIFCMPCVRNLLYHKCPICRDVEITEVTKDEIFELRVHNLMLECPYKNQGCTQTIPLHNYQDHENNCCFSTKNLLPKVYRGNDSDESTNEMEKSESKVKRIIDKFERKNNSQNDIQEPFNYSEHDINKSVETDSWECQTNDEYEDAYDQDFLSYFLANVKKQENDSKNVLQPPNRTDDTDELRSFKSEAYESEEENEPEAGGTIKTSQEKISQQPSRVSYNQEEYLEEQTIFDSDELDGQCTIDIWKIDDFERKWEKAKYKKNVNFKNKHFYHADWDLDYDVQLWLDKTDILIDMFWFMRDSSYIHARKFTLIDQSDNIPKRHICLNDMPYFSNKPAAVIKKSYYHVKKFVSRDMFEKEYGTYVRDDSILIKVSLIPMSLMYKSVSWHDGNLLWRIGNYSLKKQDAIKCVKPYVFSESFYTAPMEYMVIAWLYPDGNGASSGKYISIYVSFIAGEFDKYLPKKFNGMAKFCLMDQSESPVKQDVYREVVFPYDKKCRLQGRHDFVLHSQAENAKYLKNDALLLKITVETL